MKTKMMILGMLLSTLASSTVFAKEVVCDWGGSIPDASRHIDVSEFGNGYYSDRVPLFSAEGKDVSIQYSEDAGIIIHVNDRQPNGVDRYAGGDGLVEYHEFNNTGSLIVTCFTK
jgi:hypothetical protein